MGEWNRSHEMALYARVGVERGMASKGMIPGEPVCIVNETISVARIERLSCLYELMTGMRYGFGSLRWRSSKKRSNMHYATPYPQSAR